MLKNIAARGRSPKLTKLHKYSVAGVATLGAATLAFSLAPGGSHTTTDAAAASTAPVAYSGKQIKGVESDVAGTSAAALKAKTIEAKHKAADSAAAAKKKAAQAAAKKKAAAQADARKKAAAASRSTQRIKMQPVSAKTYANNLDGWIRESLDIMKAKGIPGSYHGLHKNIMRESSGNPMAINDWDINAINGIPSKGLLQVIPPTFKAYHVEGTSWDIYNPVANITAAANYAADKYGSMDNVNSAY